jgi:hypothetical protein
MYRSLQYIGATILVVVFCLLIVFTLLNFMLGCESWDEQYWTAYNSCITPTEFIGVFLP